MDHSLRGKRTDLSTVGHVFVIGHVLTICVFAAGVSERRRVPAPLRGSDRSSAQPADPVWLGSLLDTGQPVPEPLGAQPPLPGIPVSLCSGLVARHSFHVAGRGLT